jgi:hypothetical protein
MANDAQLLQLCDYIKEYGLDNALHLILDSDYSTISSSEELYKLAEEYRDAKEKLTTHLNDIYTTKFNKKNKHTKYGKLI